MPKALPTVNQTDNPTADQEIKGTAIVESFSDQTSFLDLIENSLSQNFAIDKPIKLHTRQVESKSKVQDECKALQNVL